MTVFGRGVPEVLPIANDVARLRRNRLFETCPDEAVESAHRIFLTRGFPRRFRIFNEGDSVRTVFLVESGMVKISRMNGDGKEMTVAVLRSGDMFGEEILFSRSPRTTYAVCIEESVLCVAKADDLFALISRYPRIALNVAKILSDKLLDASATMEDLAYATISERIVHLFRRLAVDSGIETASGMFVDVKLTHADIAMLVGSTRETVTVEFRKLARSGRILHDGRNVTLPR